MPATSTIFLSMFCSIEDYRTYGYRTRLDKHERDVHIRALKSRLSLCLGRPWHRERMRPSLESLWTTIVERLSLQSLEILVATAFAWAEVSQEHSTTTMVWFSGAPL